MPPLTLTLLDGISAPVCLEGLVAVRFVRVCRFLSDRFIECLEVCCLEGIARGARGRVRLAKKRLGRSL
jgi:hypothetical protein